MCACSRVCWTAHTLRAPSTMWHCKSGFHKSPSCIVHVCAMCVVSSLCWQVIVTYRECIYNVCCKYVTHTFDPSTAFAQHINYISKAQQRYWSTFAPLMYKACAVLSAQEPTTLYNEDTCQHITATYNIYCVRTVCTIHADTNNVPCTYNEHTYMLTWQCMPMVVSEHTVRSVCITCTSHAAWSTLSIYSNQSSCIRFMYC